MEAGGFAELTSHAHNVLETVRVAICYFWEVAKRTASDSKYSLLDGGSSGDPRRGIPDHSGSFVSAWPAR